jgi:hypothetical protein
MIFFLKFSKIILYQDLQLYQMKNDFNNSLLGVIQTYISNLHYHNSNNIIKHYLNIVVYHIFRNFRIHMHYKLYHNLVYHNFTITLQKIRKKNQ